METCTKFLPGLKFLSFAIIRNAEPGKKVTGSYVVEQLRTVSDVEINVRSIHSTLKRAAKDDLIAICVCNEGSKHQKMSYRLTEKGEAETIKALTMVNQLLVIGSANNQN